MKDLYQVLPCERKEIKDFIEKWHYSNNINGVISDYCFKLVDNEENLIGGMIFGKLGMANAWKKYGECEADVTELRRLCCIDDTPKNTESYFIGAALRYLKKNTKVKTIVSYADANYNHSGTIYKASNFEYKGLTAKGKVIVHNGKKTHDKSTRAKYKGELKPYAKRLIAALADGTAHYENTLGKHIYVYQLRK